MTGSQAYGTPGPDSDVDLAIRISREDAQKLVDLIPGCHCSAEVYDGQGRVSLRFGKLNLVCLLDDDQWDAWLTAHGAATILGPVTKEKAAEIFQEIRKGRCL